MNPSIDIDYTGWNKAANEMVRRLGMDADEVLRTQGAYLALTLMNYTPPFARYGINNPARDYKLMQESINKNLIKRAEPVVLVEWQTQQLKDTFRRLLQAGDKQTMEKIAKATLGEKWTVAQWDESMHKGNGGLDRRGRARKAYRLVTRFDDWNSYRTKLLGRIGFAKAGWAKAAADMGRQLSSGRAQYQVPEYVRRHAHSGAPGSGTVATNQQNPNVVVKNWAKGIGNYAGTMRNAIKRRSEAMWAQVAFMLDKAAKQAGFSTRSMQSNYRWGDDKRWHLTN